MMIKAIVLILYLIISFNIAHCNNLFTIMLNPAGDAKDAGRMLQNSFERGVTLQFVQELKKKLEQSYLNIRVVLTRIPGETIEYLQNANFSNRLESNLYLSIHFFKESEKVPRIFLYHYLSNTFYIKSSLNLFFYSFEDAHLINISKTLEYAHKLKNNFQNSEYNNKFDLKGLYGIPFKPLIGIKAPAIAIEIGLNTEDFFIYIKIINDAIGQIINE